MPRHRRGRGAEAAAAPRAAARSPAEPSAALAERQHSVPLADSSLPGCSHARRLSGVGFWAVSKRQKRGASELDVPKGLGEPAGASQPLPSMSESVLAGTPQVNMSISPLFPFCDGSLARRDRRTEGARVAGLAGAARSVLDGEPRCLPDELPCTPCWRLSVRIRVFDISGNRYGTLSSSREAADCSRG